MKKKTIVAAALASCFALSATLTGCSVVSTNNKADMAQVIATVDITKAENFNESGLSAYKDAISTQTSVYKRDLVSYFLTVGYSLVNSGKTYEETFNMLMDALVENAVLVQYSTMALLEIKAKENSGALEEYKNLKTQKEKYEYLLDDDDIQLAKYKLYSSVNSAIDGLEKTYIEEEKGYTGTATRTTPVNLETEQDDYYPQNEDGSLNYNIYTGFAGEGYNNLLANSGAYEDDALEGTNIATRVKAYNKYLKNLKENDLITESEEKGNLKNVLNLSYLDEEYVNQLESRIINKYFDVYEEQQGERLLADGYDYIQNRYDELLASQTKDYKTASAFETAMSSISDSSFLLYSPETEDDNELEGTIEGYSEKAYGRFGFVYNILLPFSAKQSAYLTGLKSILSADEDDNYYYNERNKLLEKIETEDQRAAWFNGATDYSFKASEAGITEYYHNAKVDSGYLFFEGNLTDNVRYKELKAYDGRYSYNGTVMENEDGSYTLLGEKLTIDGMLDEFSAYIDYVLGYDKVCVTVNKTENYYGAGDDKYNLDFYKDNDDDEIDYSKFLYAYGKVDFGEYKHSDLFNANAASDQYKAMSAVNELQFAYTTDTGVLSQYAGYSVSAYDTSYIKEFEYAAKLAISNGAGAFTVCAGDYGWHLIYVTSVFDNGATYGTPDWSRVKDEGTFEYMFYEWLKSNDTSDFTSTHRSKIIKNYSKEDKSVIKYQSRYQDLLDLKNDN